MTELEKALNAYMEKFDEPFPLIIVNDLDNEEIIEEIMKCIEKGVPAEPPEYDDNADY